VKLGFTVERWLPRPRDPLGARRRHPDWRPGLDLRIDMRPHPLLHIGLDRAGREVVLSVVDEWRGKVRAGEVVIETERI